MERPEIDAYGDPGPEITRILRDGSFVDVRQHPYGSNAVFLATLEFGGESVRAIYKPQRGEAPLWDFPPGTLYLRECAAYVLSRAVGWDIVPFTIARDGPYGIGSMQICVDHNPAENYFTFRNEHREALERIALFDVVSNNADRKGSHCMRDPAGNVWGIDHGLTFNVYYKLRTVIWDFEGEPIPGALVQDLERLRPLLADGGDCAASLGELLFDEEIEALRERLDLLLEEPVYPFPGLDRNVPWPPL